jgi:hypothetical protein
MVGLITMPKLNDVDPQAGLADVLARIASTISCLGTGTTPSRERFLIT